MNKDRLLKLAEHLESGELRSGEFNLCRFNACALGECTAIWPDEWYFADMVPIVHGFYSASESSESWFGVGPNESGFLFFPASSEEEFEQGYLPTFATRYDVARHIREFVARKEEE